MQGFLFLRPELLALFIPLAFMVWLLLRRQDDEAQLKRLIDPTLLEHLLIRPQDDARRIKAPWLLAVTLGLMIIAVSGPSWHTRPDNMRENETMITAVMKVDESMESTDLRPSRLKRAVFKLKDLMEAQSDAKTMLIAYSGSAHLVMPLSKDADIIYSFASSLAASMMPKEGDALHDALRQARKEMDGRNGSTIVFCDSVSPSEITKLKEDAEMRDLSVIFYAIGSPELLDLASIKKAADVIDAKVIVHTADERDIKALQEQIANDLKEARSSDLTAREDGGRTLIPLIFIALLFWFRRGVSAQIWRVS